MPIRRLGPIASAIALATLSIVPADAGPAEVRAVLMEWGSFLPGDTDYPELPLEVPQGSRLLFANVDYVMGAQGWGAHSLVEEVPAGELRQPRFASEQLEPGSSGEVVGIAALEPGSYDFYCSTHGNSMRGTLRIV